MNEQLQGGLNQVAQAPPPNQANQPVQPAPKLDQASQADQIASENLSNKGGFDVDAEMSKYRQGQNVLDTQIQKMQEALTKRMQPNQGLNYDPKLLALGIGMAQPTKTGNFFESLGQGASAYNKASQDELTGQSELMNKQVALQRSVQEDRKQRLLENASSKLYKKVKDPYGQDTFVFDPNAAQLLTQLSGDPKYVAQIVDQQKKTNIETAYRDMFTQVEIPGKEGEKPTTSYQVNPTAVRDIFRLAGPKDALEFIKAIPEMRKAGLLGDRSTEGTPFDALAMMAQDPTIRQQAVLAAQRYKSGLIKEEDADKLANQMLTMMTSHMDRQSALAQSAAVSSMANLLAREKLEEKIRENQSKLTDEQKILFRQSVIPIINEGTKASSALSSLAQIENVVGQAPSGVIKGVYAKSVGALFGTDDNTALANLSALSKSLITQIPRLPGSASNLDAKNLEASIGNLADPFKTNEQRIKIIAEIRDGFQRLQNRADSVQEYWDTNRKLPKWTSDNAPAGTPPSGKPKFTVLGTEPAKAP
jgi:hypothetical protein